MPTISVTKFTDEKLLLLANSFTTGRESHMTLETAYKNGHSTIRTQLFFVQLADIPLFVASQLVRSHVGVQFFQLSKRTDRGGADFREECRELAELIANGLTNEALQLLEVFPCKYDRYAPTDLAFIINAEALINMAHKRLCAKASHETMQIVQGICDEAAHCDPALAPHLVPQCIFRGGICPEPRSCRFNETPMGKQMLADYRSLFENHG